MDRASADKRKQPRRTPKQPERFEALPSTEAYKQARAIVAEKLPKEGASPQRARKGMAIEAEVGWAQCDECNKWRILAIGVLEWRGSFNCELNTWSSQNACHFNEDAEESAKDYNIHTKRIHKMKKQRRQGIKPEGTSFAVTKINDTKKALNKLSEVTTREQILNPLLVVDEVHVPDEVHEALEGVVANVCTLGATQYWCMKSQISAW
jgi:hypothetical protein